MLKCVCLTFANSSDLLISFGVQRLTSQSILAMIIELDTVYIGHCVYHFQILYIKFHSRSVIIQL